MTGKAQVTTTYSGTLLMALCSSESVSQRFSCRGLEQEGLRLPSPVKYKVKYKARGKLHEA